jgi:hypothetical protein
MEGSLRCSVIVSLLQCVELKVDLALAVGLHSHITRPPRLLTIRVGIESLPVHCTG